MAGGRYPTELQVIGEVALLENLQSKDGTFHQAARRRAGEPVGHWLCGAPDNSSLSHFSTMMLPSHRHRHATEHASRRCGKSATIQSECAVVISTRWRGLLRKRSGSLADEAFAAAMRLAIVEHYPTSW